MSTQPSKDQLIQGVQAAATAGDTAAANELAAEIERLYPEIETPIADGLQAAGNAVEAFTNKGDATTQQFQERVAGGLYGPAGFGVSDSAHLVGAGIEYAAGRAWDAVTSFTPQEIQDATGDLMQRGLTAGTETVTAFLNAHPKAMEGVKLLGEGYGKLDTWLSQNPGIAGDFQTVFDVSSAILPAAKMGPVIDATVGRVGDKLKRKGTMQSIDEKRDGVKELIYPENKIGAGETTEGGLPFRERKYEGDMREDEIAEALLVDDAIDPSRTFTHNQNQVMNSVKRERIALDQTIKDGGNPRINTKELMGDIQSGLDDIQNLPGTELLVGDAAKMAENFLNTAKKMFTALGDNPTTLEVLNMRRAFDAEVRKTRGNQFDATGQKDTAITVVNKTIRDTLNRSVMDALPDSDIYHALRQQHLMLSGYDILRKRMFDEKENTIKRLWHNVSRVTHLPKTPLALSATAGAAGALLGGTTGAVLGAGAGVGLTGYAAYKTATSSRTKKALGVLLSKTNEAIKKTENSHMVSQLKADRLMLIEMIKESTPEEERPPRLGAAN